MSRRKVWEKLLERFDPRRTSYVPEWWADRPASPAGNIVASLGAPGTPHILLTGATGIGKTTELLRVAQARTRDDFVVFLDLERHFSEVVGDPAALQLVHGWEICFLAGIALVRAAHERLDFEFPPSQLEELASAWSRLAKATETPAIPPQFDVMSLGRAMILLASAAAPAALGAAAGAVAGAGLRILEKATDGAKWLAPLGRAVKRVPDQDADVQSLVQAVNVLIGLVQKRSTRVLLVLDGLDRVWEISHARALFVDSNLITDLDAALVVCGPSALRHSIAATAVRGFTDRPVLRNEPVLDHDDPSKPGPGVPFFRELFEKRVAGLRAPGLVPRELLDRLAYLSGGRAREFITFLWQVAREAWIKDVAAVDAVIVDKVIRQNRLEREEGMTSDHLEILERMATDPGQRPPAGKLVDELLATGSLLPFINESEWFYPHPLLMMNLVKTRRSGPTT